MIIQSMIFYRWVSYIKPLRSKRSGECIRVAQLQDCQSSKRLPIGRESPLPRFSLFGAVLHYVGRFAMYICRPYTVLTTAISGLATWPFRCLKWLYLDREIIPLNQFFFFPSAARPVCLNPASERTRSRKVGNATFSTVTTVCDFSTSAAVIGSKNEHPWTLPSERTTRAACMPTPGMPMLIRVPTDMSASVQIRHPVRDKSSTTMSVTNLARSRSVPGRSTAVRSARSIRAETLIDG